VPRRQVTQSAKSSLITASWLAEHQGKGLVLPARDARIGWQKVIKVLVDLSVGPFRTHASSRVRCANIHSDRQTPETGGDGGGYFRRLAFRALR